MFRFDRKHNKFPQQSCVIGIKKKRIVENILGDLRLAIDWHYNARFTRRFEIIIEQFVRIANLKYESSCLKIAG